MGDEPGSGIVVFSGLYWAVLLQWPPSAASQASIALTLHRVRGTPSAARTARANDRGVYGPPEGIACDPVLISDASTPCPWWPCAPAASITAATASTPALPPPLATAAHHVHAPAARLHSHRRLIRRILTGGALGEEPHRFLERVKAHQHTLKLSPSWTARTLWPSRTGACGWHVRPPLRSGDRQAERGPRPPGSGGGHPGCGARSACGHRPSPGRPAA